MTTNSLEVWAALHAAAFAQAIGLPPGNMWEPGIARSLQQAVEAGGERMSVLMGYAFQFGLPLTPPATSAPAIAIAITAAAESPSHVAVRTSARRREPTGGDSAARPVSV